MSWFCVHERGFPSNDEDHGDISSSSISQDPHEAFLQPAEREVTRLTGDGITLSVEEPRGDFEFQRILKDSYDLVKFLLGERTSSLCGVDLCLFQDKRGEATSYTSDSGDSDTDALSSFDIGVHDTQYVLELCY